MHTTQEQIDNLVKRMEKLEEARAAVTYPPPPMTTSAEQDASIAAAEADTESQVVRDLRAEIAKLTERSGFINSEISQATLTIQELQLILKQPEDQTQKELAEWARGVMARLPNP